MFLSKVAARLSLVSRLSGTLHHQSQSLSCTLGRFRPARCQSFSITHRHFNSAADNKLPPKLWMPLEPELEEVLVPRKLAVSPLESWLSLRYSLPTPEAAQPLEEGNVVVEAVVLPPASYPVLEGEEGNAPLSCKNVLEIRRRKMNRHKYKKLLKRTKFLRRRVKEGRLKRKQSRFEKDLTRIWKKAGLKKAPEGWTMPKIFTKQY
ncbi:aurora kinase A-interacting protein [Alosa sapidissima]|uniref:aurora kinase A-interacting protein n=1 Tax=Alosa sapidissima TaxID=34773 RepID=UPI001C086D84|nr:aurora kinase A-interacting protein [Alosa sapidissima]